MPLGLLTAVALKDPRDRTHRLLPRLLFRYPGIWAASITLVSAGLLFLLIKLLSLVLFSDSAGREVYWPFDAVLVAVMLMVPRRCWPWMLLGSSLALVGRDIAQPWPEIAADVLGNLAESLIAAFFLPPFRTLDQWMRQPRLITRFVGGALLLATLLPACGYGLYRHLVFHQDFLEHAEGWMSADMLGMALGLPLVLVLRSRETYDLFRWPSVVFTTSLLGFTCALSWSVFHLSNAPVAFIILPVLLLVVFQLGYSGSVLAVNLLAILVSSATARGYGPFHLANDPTGAYRMAILQLFLTMSMLMSLPVSVVLLERKRFESDLKEAYLSMEQAATQDGLTGIANRRRFDLALEQEWRRTMREGRSIALLMIDADSFKAYNDCYGHLAGDQCLFRLAHAIDSIPSRSPDLAARYGGEEFVVLLPESGMDAASALADRIRLAVFDLQMEHRMSAHGVVTVSIGCGVVEPRSGALSSVLIERADQALYAAKLGGRNRVELWSSSEVGEPAR